MIIDQILDPGARQRLNRLKLVKPDKARSVEDSLINAATSGKLKGQVAHVTLTPNLSVLVATLS